MQIGHTFVRPTEKAPLYVIAGDRDDFDRYFPRRGLAPDRVAEVENIDTLKDVRNPRVALAGAWYRREDLAELVEAVHLAGGELIDDPE